MKLINNGTFENLDESQMFIINLNIILKHIQKYKYQTIYLIYRMYILS
jgi:hypothetical protein